MPNQLSPFEKEFAKQRKLQGPGKTFEWNGKWYTTDYADEAEIRRKKKIADDAAAAAADAERKRREAAEAQDSAGNTGNADLPIPGAGGGNNVEISNLIRDNVKNLGRDAPQQTDVTVTYVNQTGNRKQKASEDWRVKVSLAPNSQIFYKSSDPGIMSRLVETQGAIFPYTPEISVSHTARYAESKLTHSNYASYFYEGSEVSAINVKGDFTVQTVDEGQYLLAVISFFRSCTKMFFGTQAQELAGSPPPVVFLSGYGKYYFPNVPCVMTNFQHTMPADCDYIDVMEDTGGIVKQGGQWKSEADFLAAAITRVPVISSVSITLQPVYSRKSLHEEFNLDKFASGELLSTRGGFI